MISFANVVMQQLISQLLRELCVHLVKDLSLQLGQSNKMSYCMRFCRGLKKNKVTSSCTAMLLVCTDAQFGYCHYFMTHMQTAEGSVS